MSCTNGNTAEKQILLAGDESAIEEIRKLLSTQTGCTAQVQPDGSRAASMALELSFDAVLVCCRHPHQEFLRLLGTLFSNNGVTVTTPSPEESVPATGA